MRGTKRTRAWVAAGSLITTLVFLSIAGCATSGGSKALEWRQVDAEALGSQKFNTLGIQTYGPNVQSLYGYILYGEGITVSVSGRITGTSLGRMSLEDVQQDYQRILRENMIQGGNLVLREVLRGGTVVGFTATMPWLNITTWDMAPDTPGPNAVLQVTFP